MVRLAGEAEMLKSGTAETAKVTVVWRVNPPPVPVIVSVYVPAGVVRAVDTVRVVEVPLVAGVTVDG